MKCYHAFGKETWAPLFHNLFPGHRFYPKPTFTLAVAMMQVVRLAFPKFRKQLQDFIDSVGADKMMLIAAKDLQCMCEFIIPTVSKRPKLACVSLFKLLM